MDDVYLKDIGSGGSAPLIEVPRTIEHPMAWSHDGRWLLAFTSDENGTYVSSWSFAARALTRVAGPRVRNLGSLAAYTTATPDHSRLLIRVSPDATQDRGEMRLIFGWQDGVRQRNP